LDLNRALYNLPNLSFSEWDYRKPKPADLEPADILVCGLGTNNDCPPRAYVSLDPRRVRDSKGYRCEKTELSRYFRSWRQAARPDALLWTVLRITTFPRFLACLDAAQAAGWTPLTENFAAVGCPANKEHIPSLVFRAASRQRMMEDEALSHWIRMAAGSHEIASFAGPPALAMYRVLGRKKVLGRRRVSDRGGAIEELGVCGAFGYIYVQDVRPDHRLALISIPKAEQFQQLFETKEPTCGKGQQLEPGIQRSVVNR